MSLFVALFHVFLPRGPQNISQKYFAVHPFICIFALSYEKEKIHNDDAGPDGDDDSLSGAGKREI